MLKKIILLALISIALAETVQELNTEFQNDALFAHNLYRKIHGVPPLSLNFRLSQLALRRATELATADELSVKQNIFDGEQVGENVGSVDGFPSYNGISASQLWYSVVNKFDEEGESSSEGASFTQMVWKSTKQVGFGIAKSKNGKFFFVAEYFPSGNVRHQYDTNVFQLTDEEIVKSCSSLDSKISLSPVVPVTTVSPVKVVKSTKAVKIVKPVTKTTTRVAPVEQDEVVITSTIPVTRKPVRITTVSPIVAEDSDVEVTTTVAKVRPTTINPDVITVDSVSERPVVVRTTTVAPVEIEITTISEEEITTVKPEIEVTTRVVRTTTPVLPVEAEEAITTRRIVTTTTTPVEETTTVVHEPVVEETTTLLPVVDEEATTVPVKTRKNLGLSKLRAIDSARESRRASSRRLAEKSNEEQ
jgi:hypothetical protein